MLRITVCDDKEKELKQTAELLETYLQSHSGLNGKVEIFQSRNMLLTQTRETGGFDIYILDSLMPELNGIDTGRRLHILSDDGEIIYLTSSNDFAANSCDI